MPSRSEERTATSRDRDTRSSVTVQMDGVRDSPGFRGTERYANGPIHQGGTNDGRYNRADSDHGYGRSVRDARPPMQEDWTGQAPSGRQYVDGDLSRRDLIAGQRGREPAMPPLSNSLPHHPERAALIQGSTDKVRDPATRTQHDRQNYPGAERGSRGSSPVRGETRGPSYDRNRATLDHRVPYDDRSGHSSYHDSLAPTGPRSDRPPVGHSANPGERFRDSMRPSHPSSAQVDPQYGRLRQEAPTHRQSESYGRLNPEHDAPSGPRLQNGTAPGPATAGRGIPPSQPPSNMEKNTMRYEKPASSPQIRQAPSGPSVRSSPRFQPPIQNQSAAPTQPAQEVETAGIHPDRLKAMQGASTSTLPRQGPMTRGGGRMPQSPTATQSPEFSRGPDEPVPSPTIPPVPRGPPTGPADRRSDKRFTGLQSVLQQSNGQAPPDRSNQGTSIRGRGSRTNNVPSPSTSGPPTPNSSFSHSDAFNRPGGPPVPLANNDDYSYNRGPRNGPPEPERRPTRQRSRSPSGRHRSYDQDMPPPHENSRDRFRNEAPPVNNRGNAGLNDMRGPPQIMERELRGGSRRAGRDEMPPQQRELEHRNSAEWGDRRVGMARRVDERDGGSLRKRGRMDDGFGDRGIEKRPRR